MMAAKIYYCKDDRQALADPTGPVVCQGCNKTMTEIGWIEYADQES